MKIVTIIGARPQFIKAGIVSNALKNMNVTEVIIHTGQHYDVSMSDIFFKEMDIPSPHYNLGIHNLSHGAMTGRMMEKIEEILMHERPSLTLVYGDTNSTLAGALASVKLHIPVAHVEAGLRSFDMTMPEEINRILTDRISKLLFCPTGGAVQNLMNEGYAQMGCRIYNTGDVMYDTLLHYREKAIASSSVTDSLNLQGKEFILATLHRAENTDQPARLGSILASFSKIAEDIPIVWPIHPRTAKKLPPGLNLKNLIMIEPVGYIDMLALLHHCRLVMTDSGGLQKESYMMKKFCLTLRDQTEWIELVETGANIVSGWTEEKILQAFKSLMARTFPVHQDLYGPGNAALQIAEHIKKYVTQLGSFTDVCGTNNDQIH